MRTVKIVADSSANLMELKTVAFDAAPLKIITAQREFVDDRNLDLDEMIGYFKSYKGRSQSSCPNPEDWLTTFGDAEDVFCVAITSGLSGSYNAACIAKEMYETEHPGRRVFVIDSLSAGPELTLLVEKLEELIVAGKSFEEICDYMPKYQKKTGLLFMLESLNNFAANGRVSPAVAKIAGVLGIRIVGKASDVLAADSFKQCARMTLPVFRPLSFKCFKITFKDFASPLHLSVGSKVNTLKNLIETDLPGVAVKIGINLGLCSFYAEKGGLLVGFEKY